MAKPEWGTKRTCQKCGVKFYDLRRQPIICPSCGETLTAEPVTRVRRPKSEPKPKQPEKPRATEEDEDVEEDLLLEDEDEDDVAVEDAADDSTFTDDEDTDDVVDDEENLNA